MKKIINEIRKGLSKILTESWFMYDPKFEIANEKWRIHKCDKDQNFPSVPHLDCVTDGRKKMNIYTGEIFLRTNKKYIEKANKKELKKLWEEWDFRKIVYNERIRYVKIFNKEPDGKIPEEYINEYAKIKEKKI